MKRFIKVWHARCHGENGDCSDEATPNITLKGEFYCNKHLSEMRQGLKQ